MRGGVDRLQGAQRDAGVDLGAPRRSSNHLVRVPATGYEEVNTLVRQWEYCYVHEAVTPADGGGLVSDYFIT